MYQSATHSELHRYLTQLVLALICLLALNTITFGFQADEKDPSPSATTEQKEDDDNNKGEEENKDEDEGPDFLKIGSPAPALNLDYWPTDNNGLLPAVKKFESGKIYVVNFFAVDNAYSVGKLKTMVELQKKYSDDPVQIICVSIGSRDETEEFLDKEIKGKDKDDKTYFDLLNSVSSAVDSERKTTMNYMARSGFLTAWTFIVGKTGKLEWLGPPTEVADPLAKIVKGKWDRKAFAKEIEPKQNQRVRRSKANRLFADWFRKTDKPEGASRTEAVKGILGILRDGAKDPANKAFRARIEYERMSLMLLLYRGKADIENLESDLIEAMESFTKLSLDDLNSELNDSAWAIYELYEAGRVEKGAEILKTAKEMAEKALKFRPKSGAVNDTVAHFAYLVDGDLDRAIKLQELAVANSGDTQADELEEFLDFLKKEQATGKKKSLQKKDEAKASEESDF